MTENIYQRDIDRALANYCTSCNGQGFFACTQVKLWPNGEMVRENTKLECTTCDGKGIDPFS